jgi:ketosteroid isomerase-like protein
MSKQNVEIVRRLYETWGRGDLKALYDLYDPDVEWDMTHSYVPDMGVYQGHDGVRVFFREWLAFFSEYHAEPEDFIDADESVVVRCRDVGRSRAKTIAGVETPAYYSEMPPFWQVFRLRHGRVVRVEFYRDEVEALEAVGLRE